MKTIIDNLRSEAYGIANTTEHFMTLAEKYVNEERLEEAKACLILLCESCDNYEESIEFNELTEKWQKYRYLVENLVPPSVKFNSTVPLLPEECTMQIKDILSLSDEEILPALSKHLSEISGGGEATDLLNKWESIVYYADELCVEVNSGGFDSYLYYHGLHFENALKALEAISAFDCLEILNCVKKKFPQKLIPKNEKALQDTIDSMEEKNINFEEEENLFYSKGEKELLKCLSSYVKENKKHFR